MWQDLTLSILQFLLIAALLPSLFGKDKPEKSTSFMTGSILLSMAVVLSTTPLQVAAASTLVAAVVWFVLFYQKAKQ